MSTCNHCGGAIFPVGAVMGYAGLVCRCGDPNFGTFHIYPRANPIYDPIDQRPPVGPAKLTPELEKAFEALRPGKIEIVKDKHPAPLQGWQCPICGTVHAPFVAKCDQDHSK